MAADPGGLNPPQAVRGLRPLYPAVACSYFGYAMMGTLFVPMLMSRTAGFLPAGDPTSRRTVIIGLLLMLYPLGQFAGNPLLGALSDRLGRRTVLLASSGATVACYVGVAVALTVKSLLLLAPFLLLCGLVEANLALAMSAIADTTGPQERGTYIGRVFVLTSVAYALGPPVGGVLAARLGYAAPFWLIAGGLLFVLAALWLRFAETLPAQRRRAAPLLGSLATFGDVVTDRRLRGVYLANLLVFTAAMGFWRVVTIYLVDEWRLSVDEVTALYAVFAVGAGVGNLVVLPWAAKRFSTARTSVVAGALAAGTLLAATLPSNLGMPGSLPLTMTAGVVASGGLAVALSAAASVVSAEAPAEEQGRVLGNNAALLVLGEVIGVSGGSFVAGADPALPEIVFAVLAAGYAVSMLSRARRRDFHHTP
jgi:DHA1 family tetracycline resistance protein-like MFS transporter